MKGKKKLCVPLNSSLEGNHNPVAKVTPAYRWLHS